jgi:hypothetical protein
VAAPILAFQLLAGRKIHCIALLFLGALALLLPGRAAHADSVQYYYDPAGLSISAEK